MGLSQVNLSWISGFICIRTFGSKRYIYYAMTYNCGLWGVYDTIQRDIKNWSWSLTGVDSMRERGNGLIVWWSNSPGRHHAFGRYNVREKYKSFCVALKEFLEVTGTMGAGKGWCGVLWDQACGSPPHVVHQVRDIRHNFYPHTGILSLV